MSKDKKSNVLSAAEAALRFDSSSLTNDRVEALTGGHGMVTFAVIAAANTIAEEILKGGSTSIEFADVRRLPVADIIEKATKAAKNAGADGANAALIVAVLMYFAGSAAQVGIPAGNRKLGATCRMIAGVDRCGVAAIPTAKMNNKISGFPAVQAVYQAMAEGKLSPVKGTNVPANVGGGPLYGHSALGEDIVWPAMAENGARIGTEAMMKAMSGASMIPEPLTCALLGAAAILEIIHPDAEVPEGHGKYGRTTSVYLAGESAVKTAGLPEKIHMRVTGKEYDTAKVVGDLALILKDIGGPSVIGMMAFDEMLAVFEEAISPGFSGGPVNSPLGHEMAYSVIGMQALLEMDGDVDTVAEKIREERPKFSLDPESAFICLNIVATKSREVTNGPVTEAIRKASEPAMIKAIHDRAEYTYDQIDAGKSVAEVVKALDDQRLATVQRCAGELFSGMTGEKVTLETLDVHSAARRTIKLVKKYWSFDPYVDLKITMGDKVADMKGFVHDVIPKVCQEQMQDVAWAIPFGAAIYDELTLAGCQILNAVVPAVVASAMNVGDVKEIAGEAEKAAYITVGIPGTKAHATYLGNIAVSIVKAMD